MSPCEPRLGLHKQRGKRADAPLVVKRAAETSVLGLRQREDEDLPDGRLQVQRHSYIYLSSVSTMLLMSELLKWGEEAHRVGETAGWSDYVEQERPEHKSRGKGGRGSN